MSTNEKSVQIVGSLHWGPHTDGGPGCQTCHALLDIESNITIPSTDHPVTAKLEMTSEGRIRITEIK